MNFVFSFFFRVIIILYKKIVSPLFLARCRYLPTCSDYGLQAIQKHGPWKGGILTIKRICRCHPWGGEGYDPIR